ncbi:MAG: hypothetical protein QME94_07520, partial [Anaerolineae bacterium]|nr:hypothetical protein [Anaerolineae bacterium]
IACAVRRQLLGAASRVLGAGCPEDEADKALSFVGGVVACDLELLLLVKQVWEQTLIYTRYGAKARKAREG